MPAYLSKPEKIVDPTYSVIVLGGSDIKDVIYEAIHLARSLVANIQFEFNYVTVTVRSDSNLELLRRDWTRANEGYIDKNVGPYPNRVLTDEELLIDTRIEA